MADDLSILPQEQPAMNTVAKIQAEAVDPLALLRAPFPEHQISKLPKPTAKREVMDKLPKGNCSVCGGYHATSKIIHLDYVGHAALTDRLLDADPHWTWEPVAFHPQTGLPMLDQNGGLWIRLTVCGVTRLGYGSADGKSGGDAIKELIGDALRNAAMRFGAALDLWHKGDLHAPEESEPLATAEELATQHLRSCAIDKATFAECWAKNKAGWRDVLDDEAYGRVVAEMKRLGKKLAEEDEPPPPPKSAAKTAHEAAVEALADDTIPF